MMDIDPEVFLDHGIEEHQTESAGNTSENSESGKINHKKVDDTDNEHTYESDSEVSISEDIDV